MTLDEVLDKARSSLAEGITEFHIVGGEHPRLPYAAIREMIAGAARAARPTWSLTAFTASEIVHFAEISGMSEEEVLLELKAPGWPASPGAGPRSSPAGCANGLVQQDLGREVARRAQAGPPLGLPTNATMLYGHVETLEERVDHLLRLRAAQDETGGFQAFIPLAFHPRNTKLSDLAPTTGVEDLKMLAAARLLLDNFPHVKAYWVMIGLKLAQVALYFGADDVDGTIVEETITKAAGSEAGTGRGPQRARALDPGRRSGAGGARHLL